jgi:hypothetical protein
MLPHLHDLIAFETLSMKECFSVYVQILCALSYSKCSFVFCYFNFAADISRKLYVVDNE